MKYSPDETRITVTVGAEGGTARVTVTDEGPGFGDGLPAALTERFRRGSNTLGIVGSGLGLTIAEDVVLAHGGDLKLDTRPGGKGACVTLVLPLG